MNKKIFLFLFVGILVILGGFWVWGIQPGSGQARWLGRQIVVQKGDTWNSLGERLEKNDLIRSRFLYDLLLRLGGAQKTLKAGLYDWEELMTLPRILSFFQISQPQKMIRVVIPEGYTLNRTARLLESKGVVSGEEFLRTARRFDTGLDERLSLLFSSPYNRTGERYTLEGILFPDTYFVPENFAVESLIKMMVSNFFRYLEKVFPAWGTLRAEELYEKIILASIVQKEYRMEQEAPMIASVFYNRLKRSTKLESCATVLYILTEVLGRKHPNRIFYADLEVESSYNTYLYKGLPPQPIASIGEVALRASFYPAESDYMFFVVKDLKKGSHTFSRSLADHDKARDAYLNNYFLGR